MTTSDPGAVKPGAIGAGSANIPTSADKEGNAPDWQGAIDPSLIARLANEFFSALPSAPRTPMMTGPAQVPAPSGGANIPAPPVAPNVPAVGAVPVPTGNLPAAPNAPLYFLEKESAAPQAVAPAYPSTLELISFPSVPGAQGAPGVPEFVSSAAPLNESELSAIPASLADVTPLRAPAYTASNPPAIPGLSAYFLEEAKTSPLASAPSFPAGNEFLSFSSVPGAQAFAPVPAMSAAGPSVAPVPESHVPTVNLPASDGAKAPSAREPKLDSFEFHPELVPGIGLSKRLFDPHVIKRDFPILQERINGKQLVWLDNAATTQKPKVVIDRLSEFYQRENSNIHRAAHTLAARATDAYEGAREKVRRFLNAGSTREIVFVRGATEGINLIAKSWGRRNVEKGDEIVITWLEHHANIVPWQQLAAEKGARLRVAPVDDDGQVILEEYEKLLGPRTRIVSFSQISNALGTITPARQMIEMAHRHGAKVLVDAAQSVAHLGADVQALDCDFLVFSGHKIFAPTGIGVVFGKADILDNTPPWQGGGNMIVDVTFEKTTYQAAPARFEAGTGNIADAVSLGAALDYLEEIGMENIARYEHELLEYGTKGLLSVPGLRLIGTAKEKAGVLSFVLDDVPPEEVGKALDQEAIAVRAGHHCAQPILRRFGLEKTVRPSLALYNTREDIDALVAALLRIQASQGNA
jgi:cysteine desulfurase/selenocysteine lyase